MIEKLILGDQTGADIEALDVALKDGFPHGEWCTRGRKSLYGQPHARYLLTEKPKDSYIQRTEWNVRDSDGSVVFTFASEPSGRSHKTIGCARKQGKHCIHISGIGEVYSNPVIELQKFVKEFGIKSLNVTGGREIKEPGINAWVMGVLQDAFFWSDNNSCMLGGPGEG